MKSIRGALTAIIHHKLRKNFGTPLPTRHTVRVTNTAEKFYGEGNAPEVELVN
jgi:hypothetical protein